MFLKRLFSSIFGGNLRTPSELLITAEPIATELSKPETPSELPMSDDLIDQSRCSAEFSGDPWVQFMLFGSKPHGQSLADILAFSRMDFDTHHDFVQWLFPNRETSPINPLAPVLSDLHVRAFAVTPELRASVDQASIKFLAFLGLREVAYGFEQADDYGKGAQYWLCRVDHNHRRISRFLTFHCEIGRKDRAVALFAYLEAALADAGLSEIEALPFWRAIIEGAFRPA
jgi:hypothetical protein